MVLRVVVVLSMGVLLVSCGGLSLSGRGAAPVTPVEVVARQLAQHDAGGAGKIKEHDSRITTYTQRLTSLQRKCREDVHQLGEELRSTHRAVYETGRSVSIGQALAAVDDLVPDGTSGAACTEHIGTWVKTALAGPAQR
jgi:hypothetical protein